MADSQNNIHEPRLTLIYLWHEEPGLILSKKHYTDDEYDKEFPDLMAAVEMTLDELLDFAEGDWLNTEDELVRLRAKLVEFMESDEVMIPFPSY